MGKNEVYKLNNRGLSLVELIVAISMGVIVSAAIAALIIFSIRMYTNESTNTAMQYELQSNINMMMDEIMGASALAVKQNSPAVALTDPPAAAPGTPYTQYAMFGDPNADVGGEKGFSGVIFVAKAESGVTDRFNIYMKKVEKKKSEYTTLDSSSGKRILDPVALEETVFFHDTLIFVCVSKRRALNCRILLHTGTFSLLPVVIPHMHVTVIDITFGFSVHQPLGQKSSVLRRIPGPDIPILRRPLSSSESISANCIKVRINLIPVFPIIIIRILVRRILC